MDSSDDYLNDKIITDELADKAIILMKKKLPTYMVNNFIARGYDTPDVISDDTLEIITQLMNTDAKSNDNEINECSNAIRSSQLWITCDCYSNLFSTGK